MKNIIIITLMSIVFSCSKDETQDPSPGTDGQKEYLLDSFLYARINFKGKEHINYGYYHNWYKLTFGPELHFHRGRPYDKPAFDFEVPRLRDPVVTGTSTIAFTIFKEGAEISGLYSFNNLSATYATSSIDATNYHVDTTRQFNFSITKVKDDPKYGHWAEGDFSCYMTNYNNSESIPLTGVFRAMMR